MTSDDARNIAIILSVGVAVLTLVKAVVEYTRQNSQRRAEHYLKLREKFSESEKFDNLFEMIEKNDPALSQIAVHRRQEFLGFYEDVALLVNSGLLRKPVAHYMFAYYAIRCWESDHFWDSMDRNSAYWRLFRHFVAQMEQVEKNVTAKPDSDPKHRL